VKDNLKLHRRSRDRRCFIFIPPRNFIYEIANFGGASNVYTYPHFVDTRDDWCCRQPRLRMKGCKPQCHVQILIRNTGSCQPQFGPCATQPSLYLPLRSGDCSATQAKNFVISLKSQQLLYLLGKLLSNNHITNLPKFKTFSKNKLTL
jgi:hypothetical protein